MLKCNQLPLFPQKDFAIEDVLSEYDSDKDGFISLSEFIGDVRGEGKITDVILKRHNDLLVISCLRYAHFTVFNIVFIF